MEALQYGEGRRAARSDGTTKVRQTAQVGLKTQIRGAGWWTRSLPEAILNCFDRRRSPTFELTNSRHPHGRESW